MKKLLFAALFLSTTAFAQDKKEILKVVDDNVSKLEAMLRLSNMRIQLSSGSDKKFDPNDVFAFETGASLTTANDSALQNYFEQLDVNTVIYHPYTFISIKNDETKLLKLLGKESFYFIRNGSMTPQPHSPRLVFTDGTSSDFANDFISPQKVEEKYTRKEKDEEEEYGVLDTANASKIEKLVYENRSGFSDIMAVQAAKPVSEVALTFDLPVVQSKLHYAQKANDTIATPFGAIKILAMQSNELVFQFPSALEKSFDVRGIYKDGRILREKSSNSNTIFSEKQVQSYTNLINLLKKAKQDVEQNKIKTIEELQDQLKKQMPEEEPELENHSTQKAITFSGPLSQVAFIIASNDTVTKSFQKIYKLVRDPEESNYEVAGNIENDRTGILGKDGNWIIKPQFDEYFRMMNRYYFTDQINDRENIYHFNPTTKKMKKIDYRLDDYDIFLDKYVKVEPFINGPIGVADAITGEIILPMEHSYIHLKENKFWVGEKKSTDKEGAYNTNFKTVMPFKFGSVEYKDGFFYTSTEGKYRKDVYDSTGRSLVSDKYYDIEYDYNNGRLLVEKANQVKPGQYENSQYFFLDETGKEVIDLKAKGFSKAEIFRDGLAAVKSAKTGLYGFIDVDGNLVLPCAYKDVSFFGFSEESHYASVRLLDGDLALIDKKGNVIKRFENGISNENFEGGEKGHKFFADGVWYNAFGERVKEKK